MSIKTAKRFGKDKISSHIWKIAIPLFSLNYKDYERDEKSNYHPISAFPVILELFGKQIADQQFSLYLSLYL